MQWKLQYRNEYNFFSKIITKNTYIIEVSGIQYGYYLFLQTRLKEYIQLCMDMSYLSKIIHFWTWNPCIGFQSNLLHSMAGKANISQI